MYFNSTRMLDTMYMYVDFRIHLSTKILYCWKLTLFIKICERVLYPVNAI